jgi:hypothetical protein
MIPGSANPLLLKSAAAGGYQVERSLRFSSSDSAFCSRTPAVAGNRRTWTWAGWVKRSKLGAEQNIFGCMANDVSFYTNLTFEVNDKIYIYDSLTANGRALVTTQLFRDPSAWFHILLHYNTTDATNSNKAKLYINGTEVTQFDEDNRSYLTSDASVNRAAEHNIGKRNYSPAPLYLDGYLADIHFIDGQALTPSSFTEVSATTGQLVPIAYTGSYGTNGFQLKFADNSAATAATLGADTSGNGNNWTPNNFSVVGGPANIITTPSSNAPPTVDYLVVAGGGGSGYTHGGGAGGGGAGGFRTANGFAVTGGTRYTVVVGNGGAPGTSDGTRGANGEDSSFSTIVSSGGGGGGAWISQPSGGSGGSGGGASYSGAVGTGNSPSTSPSQGSNGGLGDTTSTTGEGGGGGGGAGAVGGNAQNTGNLGGTGGNGSASSISGSSVTYAGGGGGGAGANGSTASSGGSGGGGNGGSASVAAQAGTPNTGGGGGGGPSTYTYKIGGAGGSGIVIIRYANTYDDLTVASSLTYTYANTGGYKIYSFTASVTPAQSAGNDSLVDTPTSYGTGNSGGDVRGNYATLNPLQKGSDLTLSNGNLDLAKSSTVDNCTASTIGMTSGKWYFELTITNLGGGEYAIGFGKNIPIQSYMGSNSTTWSYADTGSLMNNASTTSYGSSYTTGDVLGAAFDGDNGTLTFYKNGISQGTAATGLTQGPYFFTAGAYNSAATRSANFGQRAFAYTAPSGFKALCDTNLGDPLVAKPNELMDVALFTGNGSSQNVTGLNFAPDFVWAKRRSAADSHLLFDAIRGATVFLGSDTTNGDQTLSSGLTAFNSDGFSWGSYGNGATFVAWAWDAGSTPVAKVYGAAATVSSTAPLATTFISNASPSTVPNSYQNYDLDLGRSVTTIDIKFTYTANTISYLVSSDGTNWTSLSTGNSQTAGATVTISDTSAFRYLRFHYPPGNFNQGFQEINNTQGSITSQVRANVSAGFSVVTYTGNGTGGATFGHGLGVKPGFSICKKRTGSPDGWYILHSSLGATKYIMLNSTNGSATYSGLWNDTEPTSTLFTVGVDYAANQNGVDYISYQFAPVVGYSSMGSYTGNGGSSNFVYTGFRPRFILIKRTDATAADGSWFLFDTARDAYNVGGAQLLADKADQEPAFYGYLDYLSNGFNIQSGSTLNGSTRQYVYAAFAENPFQYARAR